MKLTHTRLLVFIFALLCIIARSHAQIVAPPPPAIPTSQHVYVLMDENHRYSDVLLKMPYLVSLGTKYAHTLNYRADESGSLLDYLWISSGSGEHAFGCNGAGCSAPITSDNIFRAVNKAGLQWRSYQESIPYAGYMGYSSGLYVRRHNPAPFYSDVLAAKTEQMKIVPFTQLGLDIVAGQLPNYAFITPNLVNDAHNQPAGTDALVTADNWLKANLPQLLSSPPFQPGGDGVLFITFDECDGAASGLCGGNTELVYTAVIGPKVKAGAASSVAYKHESVLRTAYMLLGLPAPYPGAAATTTPMYDLFNPDGLKVLVPRDGASQLTTPVRVQATDQKAVRIEVWLDHIKKYSANAQAINVLIPMTSGVHRLVVVGVAQNGTLEQKVESITVK